MDCVCGIPDFGVGMALGYAEGKGVPYHRAIAKYTPTWPRSFTPANQEMRSLVAKMKLIPNRTMLEGKRILFCDDSIVRGTQLRDNVKILYDYGAKEVHMRIACPPLIYSCPFIGFTSSKSPLELITRRIIKELEGDENKNLDKYAKTDSHCRTVRTQFTQVQYVGDLDRSDRPAEMQSLHPLFRRFQPFLIQGNHAPKAVRKEK